MRCWRAMGPSLRGEKSFESVIVSNKAMGWLGLLVVLKDAVMDTTSRCVEGRRRTYMLEVDLHF